MIRGDMIEKIVPQLWLEFLTSRTAPLFPRGHKILIIIMSIGLAQVVTKKVRAKRNRCRAWTFKSSIETNLLSAEGVPTDEKTKLLAEHVRTRLGHKQPHAVLSVTAFSDLRKCSLVRNMKALPFRFPWSTLYNHSNARCTKVV